MEYDYEDGKSANNNLSEFLDNNRGYDFVSLHLICKYAKHGNCLFEIAVITIITFQSHQIMTMPCKLAEIARKYNGYKKKVID